MITPNNIGHVAGAALLMVTGLGLIVIHANEDIQLSKAVSLFLRQTNAQTALEEAQTEASEALARQRFLQGCARFDGELVEGLILTGTPPRTAICTPTGITGVTAKDGRVEAIARTTDQALILRRFSQ
ncbi:MAG: hypothetical protein F6K42_39540 [Leptolyngbya sp. SIO1D8]|nr:hypothetical protein [Leptolyngbya sp. SIO1D8]